MPSFYDDWKANKPKTLFKEPYSDAAKVLDEALDHLTKPQSVEELGFISGAAKGAKRAAEATITKCNKTIHQKGIQYLTKKVEQLDNIVKKVATQQIAVNQFLTEFDKGIDKVSLAIKVVLAPNHPPVASVVKVMETTLDHFVTWCNGEERELGTEGISFGDKGPLFETAKACMSAKLLAKDLLKIVQKTPVDEHQRQENLNELKKQQQTILTGNRGAKIVVSKGAIW